MICDAGGSYDVPAFRPTPSNHPTIATSRQIPNTSAPAIPDQAEIVGRLYRGQRVLADCAWCDSGNALLGHDSEDGGPVRPTQDHRGDQQPARTKQEEPGV